MSANRPPQKLHTFVYTPEWQGKRLKPLLRELLPELSSRSAFEVIRGGLVKNEAGDPVADADAMIPEGTNLVVDLRHGIHGEGTPKRTPLDERVKVLLDDNHIVVIAKAAGVLTAPAPDDAQPNRRQDGPPVVEALKHYWRSHNRPTINPILIQRLDMETSGLMVLAKNPDAATALQAQLLPPRRFERVYTALAAGHFSVDEGTWKSYLGRGPTDTRQTVGDHNRVEGLPDDAQLAETHFRVLEQFGKASLVELRLATGRTHQIRIHCAEAGHPLLGDKHYQRLADRVFARFEKHDWQPFTPENPCTEARALFNGGQKQLVYPRHQPKRVALHSARIRFEHPATKEMLEFEEPLPADLKAYLKTIS